jgi:zinc transport system ATP-binding protein
MLKVNNALIASHDVSLKIGGRLILDNVNLAVRPGEIVTIIGPNGAGKSTLVKVLLSLVSMTSGKVEMKPAARWLCAAALSADMPNVPLDVRRLMTLTLQANKRTFLQR